MTKESLADFKKRVVYLTTAFTNGRLKEKACRRSRYLSRAASHTPSPDSGAAISREAKRNTLSPPLRPSQTISCRPIHEKAMPVILTNIDEQKLWLTEGDEALLRPYVGEMEFDQLPDTLEHLYPEENQKC